MLVGMSHPGAKPDDGAFPPASHRGFASWRFAAAVPMTPRMVRVTLAGHELEGLTVEHPAASVRLLLRSPDAQELVIPTWHGNEFLPPDGRRPAIRTFTPRLVGSEPVELDLEIVIHDGGVASEWAETAEPASRRRSRVPAATPSTAMPTPSSWPVTRPPSRHQPAARGPARRQAGAGTSRSHTLTPSSRCPPIHARRSSGATRRPVRLAAMRSSPPSAAHLAPGTRVGGRRSRGVAAHPTPPLRRPRAARAHATVRGYWKHGRRADTEDDAWNAA